jgi:hypothetical protein
MNRNLWLLALCQGHFLINLDTLTCLRITANPQL